VPPISGFQRTVVIVEFHSHFGEYLFLRGGVSYIQRPRMSKQKYACDITGRYQVYTVCLKKTILVLVVVG